MRSDPMRSRSSCIACGARSRLRECRSAPSAAWDIWWKSPAIRSERKQLAMEALRSAQQPELAPTESVLTERSARTALSLRERLMVGLVLSLLLWSVCGSAAAYFLARHFTTQA